MSFKRSDVHPIDFIKPGYSHTWSPHWIGSSLDEFQVRRPPNPHRRLPCGIIAVIDQFNGKYPHSSYEARGQAIEPGANMQRGVAAGGFVPRRHYKQWSRSLALCKGRRCSPRKVKDFHSLCPVSDLLDAYSVPKKLRDIIDTIHRLHWHHQLPTQFLLGLSTLFPT